jgi:cellulose synthase/poly-beta-1,6-N-acetylglucosamine synthase-like glycosyltransferase
MEVQRIILYIAFFLTLFIVLFFLSIFLGIKKRKEKPLLACPEVTFVIPAYNVADYIEKTIEAVFDSDYPKNKINVIVVNDGSTDNTLEKLNYLKKKYKINVLTKKNEGKALALNYGLKHVKTSISVVLDADTLPKKDLLRKAILQFEDKDIMAVTCRMIPLNRNKFLEKMQAVEYTFTSFYRRLLHYKHSLQTTPAFTVFKTEFFRKYGYFDPYNMTEDLDMGMRIQKAHYDIGFVFDSYAMTAVPSTFRGLARQRIRWHYGTFQNLFKYRKMLGLKYGDLGFFYLPTIILTCILILSINSLIIYNLTNKLLDFIHRLALGWRPSFLDYNLFTVIVSLTDLKLILTFLVFIVGLGSFLLIRKETNEKFSIIDWILYLFIYTWLLAYFYIANFYFLIFKKPKW